MANTPHCSNNPNVPCLCLLGESRYGTAQSTHHPTRTSYSECIDKHFSRRKNADFTRCGIDKNNARTPQTLTCAKGCCGSEYIDVHGERRKIDLNFPYALVVYRPAPMERYFQTKERAVLEAPRCGDWQIIHLPTGQIIYEPNTAKSNC